MMSADKSWNEQRNMAAASAARQPRDAGRPQGLSLSEAVKLKAARSPDPYNSTGSFDRTQHWARVGKR